MAGGSVQVQVEKGETITIQDGEEDDEEEDFRKSATNADKRNHNKLHNNSRQANIIFWLVIGLFLIVPIVIVLCFGVHMMLEKIVLQDH